MAMTWVWCRNRSRMAPAVGTSPRSLPHSSSGRLLAAAVLLVGGGLLLNAHLTERRYLRQLQAEITALEPVARHADALSIEIQQDRARVQLLDQFRNQTRADLNALNELTRLVEPPAW